MVCKCSPRLEMYIKTLGWVGVDKMNAEVLVECVCAIPRGVKVQN